MARGVVLTSHRLGLSSTHRVCFLSTSPSISPLWPDTGAWPQGSLGAPAHKEMKPGVGVCILRACWNTEDTLHCQVQTFEGFEIQNKMRSAGQMPLLPFWKRCCLTLRCSCSCLGYSPEWAIITWPSLQGKERFKSSMNLNKKWKWLSPFILINIMSTFLG